MAAYIKIPRRPMLKSIGIICRRINIACKNYDVFWKMRRKEAVVSERFKSSVCSYHQKCLSGLPTVRHASTIPEITKGVVLSPEKLSQQELADLHENIRKELNIESSDLDKVSQYYFDGKGKAFRPMVVTLVSKACNFHSSKLRDVLPSQLRIAAIAEMIHTASLMHDDVIDAADTRRSQSSINHMWGQKKAILAGDYVMAKASMALARIGNPEVVIILAQVMEDLVKGEFMQLGSKENVNERFSHYLTKTYKKTASLLANSSKAVAILGQCSEEVCNIAFEYGRNIGMAFQLVDDILDFTSTDDALGKPTVADLKLGLATAPVLFAALKHPELNEMIMRRFKGEGDVEKAREAVLKSNSIEEAEYLAYQHSREAVLQIQRLDDSPERRSLEHLTQRLLNRKK
ncbi:Decaprenyl-diphosphate synthase subunit 1 [Holothuria leucospilota]|uniref:All trans-polyprenyl-diphosphate synthase PDSS1 n=1 Tax=Holothuria leucospilota TaxID=206669 RepID=A0A9Q1C088_HOLLE|nr:Decaprenyl-diphosphate synthase subunit 1 [Holothuria leucospilota]